MPTETKHFDHAFPVEIVGTADTGVYCDQKGNQYELLRHFTVNSKPWGVPHKKQTQPANIVFNAEQHFGKAHRSLRSFWQPYYYFISLIIFVVIAMGFYAVIEGAALGSLYSNAYTNWAASPWVQTLKPEFLYQAFWWNGTAWVFAPHIAEPGYITGSISGYGAATIYMLEHTLHFHVYIAIVMQIFNGCLGWFLAIITATAMYTTLESDDYKTFDDFKNAVKTKDSFTIAFAIILCCWMIV